MDQLIVLAIGLGIGLISGFLGLGGGALIVPLLPIAAPMAQVEVIATSLFTILLVVVNNTISFHRKKLVSWKFALVMGPLTAVTAFASARFAIGLSDQQLRLILAVVLLVIGIRTGLKKIQSKNQIEHKIEPRVYFWICFWSLFAGALSGLTGIGAGLVLSAILINFQLIANEKLSPTSNAVMCFTTSAGILAYIVGAHIDWSTWRLGLVHLDKVLILFLGATITSQYARKKQHLIAEGLRKKILVGLLILLSVKVFVTALT